MGCESSYRQSKPQKNEIIGVREFCLGASLLVLAIPKFEVPVTTYRGGGCGQAVAATTAFFSTDFEVKLFVLALILGWGIVYETLAWLGGVLGRVLARQAQGQGLRLRGRAGMLASGPTLARSLMLTQSGQEKTMPAIYAEAGLPRLSGLPDISNCFPSFSQAKQVPGVGGIESPGSLKVRRGFLDISHPQMAITKDVEIPVVWEPCHAAPGEQRRIFKECGQFPT